MEQKAEKLKQILKEVDSLVEDEFGDMKMEVLKRRNLETYEAGKKLVDMLRVDLEDSGFNWYDSIFIRDNGFKEDFENYYEPKYVNIDW